MRSVSFARLALILPACIMVAGCFSRPIDTKLVQSLLPKDASEERIHGELLKECLANKSPALIAKVGDSSFAKYNAYASYKMAERLQINGVPDAKLYADRVRAYSFPYVIEGKILWDRSFTEICFYEKTVTGLRFLTRVTADNTGAVYKQEVSRAFWAVYENMSGKKVSNWEQLLFSPV